MADITHELLHYRNMNKKHENQLSVQFSSVAQSCPTLCYPTDRSLPGSFIPGILQARTLAWVAISFSNAWKWSHSVVSDSSRPHGLQPTRLLRPWDFSDKSTGVGCHCLLHCWWDINWYTSSMENSMEVPKKAKNRATELLYDPAIPLLGIYHEKIILWKDTCIPMFTATLFTIACKLHYYTIYNTIYNRTRKQPKCLAIDKGAVYIYTMQYYSAIKKNKIMPFAAIRMDLEIIIQSEVSQRIWYRLYVESKKDTNGLI